jgi:hypothetical protein
MQSSVPKLISVKTWSRAESEIFKKILCRFGKCRRYDEKYQDVGNFMNLFFLYLTK